MSEVPFGTVGQRMTLCECGCGQETIIYFGEHRRFIHGHYQRTKTYKDDPLCRSCGATLTDDNWATWRKSSHDYICNTCNHAVRREYYKANREKMAEKSRDRLHANGVLPMNENNTCSAFLGVYIAERVLQRVFDDVKTMPYATPGFDFVCNKGKKIDVKSACVRIRPNMSPSCGFRTKKNTKADFFLCLAFDNREDLNPVYLWLIPSWDVKHIGYSSISESTIHKWDKYIVDINKVVSVCDIMRGE